MSNSPKLVPNLESLDKLVDRYQYGNEIDLGEYYQQIERRGCLTSIDLQRVAAWKSPRSAGHVKKNSDQYVQEITGIALNANEERTRVEVLCVLDGVSWPTASVILHFYHKNRYPILDFRALFSVSLEVPNQYTYRFWWEYVKYCRELSTKSDLTMRELDQALWQYSKENQDPV